LNPKQVAARYLSAGPSAGAKSDVTDGVRGRACCVARSAPTCMSSRSLREVEAILQAKTATLGYELIAADQNTPARRPDPPALAPSDSGRRAGSTSKCNAARPGVAPAAYRNLAAASPAFSRPQAVYTFTLVLPAGPPPENKFLKPKRETQRPRENGLPPRWRPEALVRGLILHTDERAAGISPLSGLSRCASGELSCGSSSWQAVSFPPNGCLADDVHVRQRNHEAEIGPGVAN
jgi:hypothetical protein